MDARTLMEMDDALRNKIKESAIRVSSIIDAIIDGGYRVADFIYDNGAIFVVILCLILYFTGASSISVITLGVLIYALKIINTILERHYENKLMQDLDMERLAQTKDTANSLSKLSINEIVGQYVEDCFNRDVLFLNPPKDDDYITEVQEREYLNLLVDSASNNMSSLMYRKLSLYTGEESLSILIGRKCLATVTIFVASHNHKIYDKGGENITVQNANMPNSMT